MYSCGIFGDEVDRISEINYLTGEVLKNVNILHFSQLLTS